MLHFGAEKSRRCGSAGVGCLGRPGAPCSLQVYHLAGAGLRRRPEGDVTGGGGMFATRVQALEARYDGPIPHDLLIEARQLDALDPLPRPAAPAPLPPAPPPSPREIVARMAAVIVQRTAASDACTEADLRTAGFTPAEIAAYGDAARSRALAELSPREITRTVHA